MDIESHYALLLGLNSPWAIETIDLNPSEYRLDIYIEYQDDRGLCPECQQRCPKHDDRLTRTWRHLDVMQFTTYVHSQIPRIRCPEHGVKTLSVPWAEKNSRFTLLFESLAIRVLQAARSIEEARKLLKLNWHQVNSIKDRAVERGLKRRSQDPIHHLGMDEKQFRSGHQYITSLVDLDAGRILDVVEERTETAADQLISNTLTSTQREEVKAIALDMWKAFANSAVKLLPNAKIVHDRFHISQHLNNAVDQVRRGEHKQLLKDGDKQLKGSKFKWLKNSESLSDKDLEGFSDLVCSHLKTAKAWGLKELFREFWDCKSKAWARKFFDSWYGRAVRCRLKPVVAKAKMIKQHIDCMLNYFEFRITNAAAEGLNSKIQTVKSNARGFKSFKNFRSSILFYCGKLDLLPAVVHG